MRKILLLSLFLFANGFNSQTDSYKITRFIYQLTYKIDSADLSNIQRQFFYLDVKDGKTRFSEPEQLAKDSTLQAIESGGNAITAFSMMGRGRPRFGYTIYRDATSGQMIHAERIGVKSFYYQEINKKIEWKLVNEQKKIGNLVCQKAITTIFGRVWTAYFSTSIPIPAGPYKFYGLPGLIVHLEDSKQQYVFQLIQHMKADVYFPKEISPRIMKVSKEDFQKMKRNFISNPTMDIPGLHMDPAVVAEANRKLREKMKKENNPLELKP